MSVMPSESALGTLAAKYTRTVRALDVLCQMPGRVLVVGEDVHGVPRVLLDVGLEGGDAEGLPPESVGALESMSWAVDALASRNNTGYVDIMGARAVRYSAHRSPSGRVVAIVAHVQPTPQELP